MSEKPTQMERDIDRETAGELNMSDATKTESKCEICGEPMPQGEEMFKYYGYSSDCPKPPPPRPAKLTYEELELALAAKTAECEKLREDAVRYQWLRLQHWSDSRLCVVESPEASLKLGSNCPSLGLLDAAIDAARKETA